MRRAVAALWALALSGCMAAGPETALRDLADALIANDAGAFLERLDGGSMARCEVRRMIREDRALSMLDSLGNRLAPGGVRDLLGQALDVERELLREYERGVSDGTLMAECRVATDPGCPWVPESLKAAEVRELSPTAAVARVVTPTRMTSWLALRQRDGRWRVVGKATMEREARDAALAPDQEQGREQDGDQGRTPPGAPPARNGDGVTRL